MKAFILGLSILLTSCAATYTPPKTGKTATLAVPIQASSWQFLGGFSGTTVSFAVKGNDGCGKVYKQISPNNKEAKFTEVKIPAEQGIFILSGNHSGNSMCSVAGEFFAIADKKYEVINLGSGYGCSVGVVEVDDNNQKTRVPLKRAYQDKWSGTTICDKK